MSTNYINKANQFDIQNLPQLKATLPLPTDRPELSLLNALPIMDKTTPGFAYFVNSFTDDMLLSYMNIEGIDKYPQISSDYRYLSIIWTVWSKKLSEEERLKWEQSTYLGELKALKNNVGFDFEVLLKQNIQRSRYEKSDAFQQRKQRDAMFLRHIAEESPFQSTTKLEISVEYSESLTSQHSLQLLKVFLGLEQFAQTLINMDKDKGITLLRQILNFNSSQPLAYLIAMLQKLMPRCSEYDLEDLANLIMAHEVKSNSSINKKTCIDYKELAFYPLTILEKLLLEFSPQRVGLKRAQQLRHDALCVGVMDFVLECLAHFTHRGSRFAQLRSWRMQLPRFTVGFSSSQPLISTQSISTSTTSASDLDEFFDPFSGSRTKTDKVNGFAKGTGFGSGSIGQKWNIKDYVNKIRYDDDNIACLLKILQVYISPTNVNVVGDKSVLNDKPSVTDLHRYPTRLGAKKAKLSINHDKPIKDDNLETQDICSLASTSRGPFSNDHGDNPHISEHSEQLPIEDDFLKILYRSSLRSTLHSYIRTDSLLEMQKNFGTFTSALNLLKVLSSIEINQNLNHFIEEQELDIKIERSLADDTGMEDDSNEVSKEITAREIFPKNATLFDIVFIDEDGISERTKVAEILKKFSRCLDEYLTNIGKITASGSKISSKSQISERNESSDIACTNEENMIQRLSEISKVIIENIQSLTTNIPEQSSRKQSLKPLPSNSNFSSTYTEMLGQLQFETISLNSVSFYFSSQLTNTQASSSRIKRIAKEIFSLRSSLILSPSSSAFVRTFEENMEGMKVLITGPCDTPYSNGCFEFDFLFPLNFPNEPPKVQFLTTGAGKVRFNPNLYADGKVCLSILGTWPGRPEEQWNAESSTILQVINSIQSLILVEQPYFNEPGFQGIFGTTSGDQHSKTYNQRIWIDNVRHAIIEQLSHPSKAFQKVIQRHFYLKKDEICKQIEGWIKEGGGPELTKLLADLKKRLSKLTSAD